MGSEHKTEGVEIGWARSLSPLLDELVELERHTFLCDRLSRRGFARFLRSSTARVLTARHNDALVGYAIVTWAPPFARLYSIGVSRGERGRGIGKLLLSMVEVVAVEQGCKKMHLEVKPRNRIAINCYSKMGYEQFGRLRRFYQNGGDALRFEKILGSAATSGGPAQR